MSVKDAFKRLIKTVDDALQIDEALLSTSEAAPPPRRQSKPTPEPRAPRPSIVSALDGLVEAGQTVVQRLEVHADIDTIVAPKYTQINSLNRIDSDLRHPFEQGLKEVTLVFVHNRLVIPARLESAQDEALVVHTRHSTYFRKRGEIVLMLIPAQPDKRYVLQLTVDEIYAHRLMLRYQDPRYDARWQLQLAAPVHLRLAPPTLQAALRQQELYLMRSYSLPPPAARGTTTGRCDDLLYEADSAAPAMLMRHFEEIPPLTGALHDLSVGGARLTLPTVDPDDGLVHRLALFDLPLPAAPPDAGTPGFLPVHVTLLSVVRGLQHTASFWTLNLRFIRRLPDGFGPYLETLERRFLAHKTPLS